MPPHSHSKHAVSQTSTDQIRLIGPALDGLVNDRGAILKHMNVDELFTAAQSSSNQATKAKFEKFSQSLSGVVDQSMKILGAPDGRAGSLNRDEVSKTIKILTPDGQEQIVDIVIDAKNKNRIIRILRDSSDTQERENAYGEIADNVITVMRDGKQKNSQVRIARVLASDTGISKEKRKELNAQIQVYEQARNDLIKYSSRPDSDVNFSAQDGVGDQTAISNRQGSSTARRNAEAANTSSAAYSTAKRDANTTPLGIAAAATFFARYQASEEVKRLQTQYDETETRIKELAQRVNSGELSDTRLLHDAENDLNLLKEKLDNARTRFSTYVLA
jgi:hypothetical protein